MQWIAKEHRGNSLFPPCKVPNRERESKHRGLYDILYPFSSKELSDVHQLGWQSLQCSWTSTQTAVTNVAQQIDSLRRIKRQLRRSQDQSEIRREGVFCCLLLSMEPAANRTQADAFHTSLQAFLENVLIPECLFQDCTSSKLDSVMCHRSSCRRRTKSNVDCDYDWLSANDSQTVAEDIFIWSVGPEHSENLPPPSLKWTLEILWLTHLPIETISK